VTDFTVLRPSRGLEYAESSDSIDEALQGYQYRIKRTWDKPIPDSFNWLVRWALDNTDSELFLFVEEDVVIPANAISLLLDKMAEGHAIAAINYRLKPDGRISQMVRKGRLLWVSLGCTMVHRQVFEELPEPWFSTDYTLVSKTTGSSCIGKIISLEPGNHSYGWQDCYFCMKAQEAGFTIRVVEGVLCEHLKLEAMGEPNRNDGCHKINRA
jgi:GT2 family glycosyltransferase